MSGVTSMVRGAVAAGALAACASGALAADSVMVQCGRDYQAARSAGTLNGMDWNAYRVACAERLKAPTAAAIPAAAVSGTAGTPVAAASAPAAPASTPSAGAAAMHARQKQCGAEWTAQKASLVAATPSLTWPKYWSQCNSRLKSTGR